MKVVSLSPEAAPARGLDVRLREFRFVQGFSQAEMAEVLGVSQPTVARLEASAANWQPEHEQVFQAIERAFRHAKPGVFEKARKRRTRRLYVTCLSLMGSALAVYMLVHEILPLFQR